MIMQSKDIALIALFGIFALGLFGVQDAYAQTPSIPQLVNPVEQSSTVIHVFWDEPASGQPIISYNVYVESPSGTPMIGSPFPHPWTGSSETFEHSGLTPSTSYFYEVTAINANGEGPTWPEQSTDTQPSVTITTIEDEFSCTDIFGTSWTEPNICTLDDFEQLSLFASDVLIIDSTIRFVLGEGADVSSSGLIINHGIIDNPSGIFLSQNTQNDGIINNSGLFTSTENFDNTSGTLTNDGSFTTQMFTNAGAVTNTSTFSTQDSFDNIGGTFTNTGALTLDAEFLNGAVTNSGLGIINNNSDWTIADILTNSAIVNNSGEIFIQSTGNINNVGNLMLLKWLCKYNYATSRNLKRFL
jgi:hypothetical protein